MWLLWLIAGISVVLDQVTKQIVMNTMSVGQSIPIIEDFFYLTSHRNEGAAWGIFQGQMMFFYVVTAIVIVIILFWMRGLKLPSEKFLGIALALILGGAIGNFIDRVLYQHVVDFLDFIILGYDFPIFNVADMSLCIGVFLMGVDAVIETVREVKIKKMQQ